MVSATGVFNYISSLPASSLSLIH